LRSFGPEPRIPALFYFVQEIKVGSKHSKTHVPKAERGYPALGRHCPHQGWNQVALVFPNKSERILLDSKKPPKSGRLCFCRVAVGAFRLAECSDEEYVLFEKIGQVVPGNCPQQE